MADSLGARHHALELPDLLRRAEGERGAGSAQELGQLQTFTAALPQECTGPTRIAWANLTPFSLKWAPAITLGNAFVLKPSPMTPMTSLRMGELLRDVFPPGVLNTVFGDDTAAFNVGTHIVNHADVAKISFTG